MVQRKENKSSSKDNHIKSGHQNILHEYFSECDLFQKLIDNIPDHIYIKDSKNRYIIVNKAKADFTNKKPEDFIGKTDFDFFPKNKAEEYSRDENLVMKKRKSIIDKVEEVSYSDKKFWMSSSKIPWYDRNGKIMGTMGISRNITRRRQLEDNILSGEKSIFDSLMDNMTESIFFKDLNSRFIRINKACAEKFGIESPEEAVGKTDFNIFSKEHAKQAFEDEQNIIKSGRPIVDLEEKETFENKADKWASTTKMPWYDQNKNIIGTFGITRDITGKEKAEEKIKYLSFHDMLTGLYNRAYFDEELRRLDTKRQLLITIVMGDINGLKVVNDAYGHVKGDIFLRRIADILKECFRKEDIIQDGEEMNLSPYFPILIQKMQKAS